MVQCTAKEAARIAAMTLQQLICDVFSIHPTNLHAITVKQNKLLHFLLVEKYPNLSEIWEGEKHNSPWVPKSLNAPSFGLIRITTDEFIAKHDLCTQSALNRFNRGMLRAINIMVNGRWMVDEKKTLRALTQSTIIRNRMKKNPEKYGHLFK
jgi:hypothetical protein